MYTIKSRFLFSYLGYFGQSSSSVLHGTEYRRDLIALRDHGKNKYENVIQGKEKGEGDKWEKMFIENRVTERAEHSNVNFD